MTSAQKHLLSLTDFKPLLGETFEFSLEGVDEKPRGILIEAKHLGIDPAPGIDRKPFSLAFQFAPGANIGQCTLQTKHTTKGTVSMFLVPYAGDHTGWYMESNFN